MSDNLKTVVLGDKAVQVATADAAAVEQFKIDTNRRIADMESNHAKEISARDQEIGTLRADLAKARDAALKPEDVSRLVADRLALERKALSVCPKLVADGKTDAQILREVVVSVMGDAAVAGVSDDVVRGMFAAVTRDAKLTADAQSQLVGGIQTVVPTGDAQANYRKALDASIAGLNAHRNQA